MPRLRPWQAAILAGLLVGYALLSHYSNTEPQERGLAAALCVGPVLVVGLLLLWRWTRPVTATLVTLVTGVLTYRYWTLLEKNYEWADLAQQCAAYGLVSLSFARTLFASRLPLCAQIAARIDGVPEPGELRYMRWATLAWAWFYAGVSAAILLLFFLASPRVWSLFVNFGTFGLILLLAAGDHALRERLFPRRSGGGMWSLIQRTLIG